MNDIGRLGNCQLKVDIKRDGLQDSGLTSTDMIEWYTLPENLYRAYQLLETKAWGFCQRMGL